MVQPTQVMPPLVARLLLSVAVGLALLTADSACAETAPGAPCGPQDYDSDEPPDFTCPGPEERDLRPELHPPEAVPVYRGWAVVDEDGEPRLTVAWDGALVHRDRLIEAGLWLHTVRRLRWADHLRLRREYDIRIQHAEAMAQARLDHMEAQRDAYQERWQASEQRVQSAQAWWRHPALWFTVGMITAGGLVALTAWGLTSVN